MASFCNRCCLLKCKVSRHGSDSFVLSYDHLLGMCPKPRVGIAKHFISGDKECYVFAYTFYHSGKLISQYLLTGLEQAAKKATDKILCTAKATIGAVDRCSIYFYKYFIVIGRRPFYLHQLYNFR